MKFVRKILTKILGLKAYLRLISYIYLRLISWGFMREKYAELYFISKLVKKGDTVLDIGANLGYYSFFLAKTVGSEGCLLAVEPIPLFAEIWQRNMSKWKSVPHKLFNCALGEEAKEKVMMSIPVVNGVVRHGLTKVTDENETGQTSLSFEVPMKVGDELLVSENLDRLDFIKCDVEGFEQFVIPSLEKNIEKFHPVLQIELSGDENRKNVVNYLLGMSYHLFILEGDLLKSIQKNDIFTFSQDFYFVHQNSLEVKGNLIRK